jgi:HK97 family phage major capsid protein
MNLNELKDTRQNRFAAADKMVRAAREAGKDLVGATLEQYQGHITEIRNLDQLIAKCEQVGAIAHTEHTAHTRVPVNHPTTFARDSEGRRLPIFAKGQSMEAYVRQEGNHNTDEDGAVSLGGVCRAMALGGGSPAVRNALSVGTDSAGGVTVPSILSTQLIDALRARNTVFQAGALTLALDAGKSTTLAAIAGDATATWRAENAAVNASDMTFSPVVLTPKTLAVTLLASREIVEDSQDIERAILISMAAAFALELDRVALLGSGSGSEPKGVSNISGIGSYSMGTNGTTVTSYDPFVQALAVLRGANAMDPTACIINPRTDLEINLLKDSQNRPLTRPQAIANLPFLVTNKLPNTETQGTATTACHAVMGKFDELIVGIRDNLRIELLREKYSDNLQYGFLCYLRADIAVRHAASFCKIVGIL